MQLLAIGLAASLLFGPAPVGDTAPPTSTEVEGESGPLPDVDDAVGSETVPETTVEPESEPEPAPEPEVTTPAAPEPEPPPPTIEQAEPEPAPAVRDRLGCKGSKACTKMSIAGIVVGTFGLAAVGTGIGLVVKRDEVIPESPTYVTSTRPAGTVTLTIGAGITLTAVLMLVAAHKGYKKRGDQARRVAPLPNGLRF